LIPGSQKKDQKEEINDNYNDGSPEVQDVNYETFIPNANPVYILPSTHFLDLRLTTNTALG